MGCIQSTVQNKDILDQPSINKQKRVQFTSADLVNERTNLISEDYILLNPPLGQGAFGEVRQGKHRQTGQIRAVKIIEKQYQSNEEQQKLINEVQILKKLVIYFKQDHPNIIKIYEFYQDKQRFYIVTELCTGGELFDYILDQGSFTEHQAANIFKSLISPIMYCHQHNIVHRDLKPENILLEQKAQQGKNIQIKIIDFGTSASFDPQKKLQGFLIIKGKFGTAYYIAPEVLKNKYNEKCDIWSAGVILYILLCGYPPFNGNNETEICESIKKGEYALDTPEWDPISIEAKSLIKNMLQFDINKRYSAQQVMQHGWMQRNTDKKIQDSKSIGSALQNMKKFNIKQKLQEATYVFMVNYLTNKDEKQRLLDIFQQIDSNGDGQLSRNELIEGFKNIMKIANPEEEVDIILAEVDKNNSGFIDYHEFVMAAVNKNNLLTKESLQTAFHLIDRVILLFKDGSGTITVDELKQQFGRTLPQEVWDEMIEEADENKDGEVNLLNKALI